MSVILPKGFTFYKNQRFALGLSNGYRIETMIGAVNMCGNFNSRQTTDEATKYFTYSSDDAEIRITKDGKDVTEEFLTVHFDGAEKNNVGPDFLAKIISIMSLLQE